jgi:acetylornithine deacetylase/succinyl-diaminopimelate desuccinylase-like protein
VHIQIQVTAETLDERHRPALRLAPSQPGLAQQKAAERTVDDRKRLAHRNRVGASDSIYTMNAGIPSYGISGVAIDHDDVRAHGRDERVPVDSFYTGVEFYYEFLKKLTTHKT